VKCKIYGDIPQNNAEIQSRRNTKIWTPLERQLSSVNAKIEAGQSSSNFSKECDNEEEK
jgi:hypothetical protein